MEGLHDDLHVHVTADSIEKVDAAVALIEPLLTPVDVSTPTQKNTILVTWYICCFYINIKIKINK